MPGPTRRAAPGTRPEYQRPLSGPTRRPKSKPRRDEDDDIWNGRLGRRHQGRQGAISTKSGALDKYPYSFSSRFEGKPGTNPEELIGAAHAGCFTMALSLILGEAQLRAEHMETKAEVCLEKVADGFAITSVHLTLAAKIPGANQAQFEELATSGKGGLSRIEAAEY